MLLLGGWLVLAVGSLVRKVSGLRFELWLGSVGGGFERVLNWPFQSVSSERFVKAGKYVGTVRTVLGLGGWAGRRLSRPKCNETQRVTE